MAITVTTTMNHQCIQFFFAHGPAFKKNFEIKSFNNVDIYQMMCLILGVTPAANNGTLHHITDMLVFEDYTKPFDLTFILLSLIPIGLVLVTGIFLCFVSKKSGTDVACLDTNSGYTRIPSEIFPNTESGMRNEPPRMNIIYWAKPCHALTLPNRVSYYVAFIWNIFSS